MTLNPFRLIKSLIATLLINFLGTWMGAPKDKSVEEQD